MIAQTNQEAHERLSAPFDDVRWRIGRVLYKPKGYQPTKGETGRALALAYVTATQVMDRLDDVLGPGNWARHHEVVFKPTDGTSYFLCNVSVNWPSEDHTAKADMAGETDVEGEKGGASDAFKRACVNYGVARYLYKLGDTECGVICKGWGWTIPPEEIERLTRELNARVYAEIRPQELPGDSPASTTPPPAPESLLGPSTAQGEPSWMHSAAPPMVGGVVLNDTQEFRDLCIAQLKRNLGDSEAMRRVAVIRDAVGPWAGLDSAGRLLYNSKLMEELP